MLRSSILITLLSVCFRFAQVSAQDTLMRTYQVHHLEWPVSDGCEMVRHSFYTLCYNEQHEQAAWVAYMLTEANTHKQIERSNRFMKDPDVSTGSATDNDYTKSGFDRGHLAPAADMSFNATAMEESFYYSNMSPQIPGFNRGVWKRLEEQVRNWAQLYDTIFIATGPVLQSDLPAIGPNRVSVPRYYYKAILTYTKQRQQAIALLLPHESSRQSLQHYVISIDSLESLTGIDFFERLPDVLEEQLERKSDSEQWNWYTKPDTGRDISSSTLSVAVQCRGFAKSTGNRCRNKTTNENGFCYRHQAQVR